MNTVYVFLADGFEEIEGLTVVDLLRRADEDVVTVSIMGRKNVTGSHKIQVQADALFEEEDFAKGKLLVLPGGMPGTM
ncbi:DJ-1/PfpI family protein, partial [Acinetobacter baumannii]|nr:DJ-1/PfpI family protein [Acinetobacter baumannii]